MQLRRREDIFSYYILELVFPQREFVTIDIPMECSIPLVFCLAKKKELKTVCGIPYSPQHIQRLENAGRFPKRIKLGMNRVAWLLTEVEAWIDERVAQRDAIIPTDTSF